ncbi:MAG: glycosyltransferase [Burkholderiales bacterium]
MKILFALPGHLKTVPMGQYCADALRDLGHDVSAFDFHPTWRDRLATRLGGKEEQPSMNARLRRLAADLSPDAFITLFGFDLSERTLSFLRARKVPTVCWWINDPFQLERSLGKAPWYDFVFSNSAGVLADYRARGVAHAGFLPTACEPRVHRPVAPRAEWRSEVCFAGDWSPLRAQVVESLARRFDVRVFGPWGRKLPADSPLRTRLHDGFFKPDDMAAMFASSEVVLNLHTWYGKFDHGVNPRLFEAAGCGVFQVVDWKQEIPTLFDCERELRCYRKLEELESLVAAALAAPAERRAAAQAARARALAEHTYAHRMQSLLAAVTARG